MAAIPVWLLGRHVTAYVVTGATAGADGTLTDATGAGIQPLAGVWDEVDFDSDPTHEEISAADSRQQNNVILQEGRRIRMSVIMATGVAAGAPAGTTQNPLAEIANGYDYFKVVFARGGKTHTQYFTRGAYNEQLRKGRCVQSLTGVPVGTPGTYAPTA